MTLLPTSNALSSLKALASASVFFIVTVRGEIVHNFAENSIIPPPAHFCQAFFEKKLHKSFPEILVILYIAKFKNF